MATTDIAAAVQRVDTVLRRHPATGLHDDSLATARWHGDGRVTTRHANGTSVTTDLPAQFGGGGELVTPGWLMRAGVAACSTACIAMWAAAEGLVLDALEVQVSSRSDARGMLGHAEPDGRVVNPGPMAMRMTVRIAAAGVDGARLHALVEKANRLSPMSAALRGAVPMEVVIDTAAAFA